MAAALVGAVGSAWAQGQSSADDLFRQGQQAYADGDYQGAYERYRQAWEMKRSYDIAGNLGNVEVADAAAELLAGDEPSPLGRCAGDHCILLFVDGSRARRRRWCSMEVCGNRAKVAAHYRRKRGS